jgi:hypothetical protein
MKGTRRSHYLKALTVAAALALPAATTVGAAAANGLPGPAPGPTAELPSVSGPQQLGPNRVQPKGSGKSYFLTEASVAAAVLAGFIVLGLYGDVAIGGVIFAVQLACASAARAARKVGTLAREASPQMQHVAGSAPPAAPREDPAPALPPPGVAR